MFSIFRVVYLLTLIVYLCMISSAQQQQQQHGRSAQTGEGNEKRKKSAGRIDHIRRNRHQILANAAATATVASSTSSSTSDAISTTTDTTTKLSSTDSITPVALATSTSTVMKNRVIDSNIGTSPSSGGSRGSNSKLNRNDLINRVRNNFCTMEQSIMKDELIQTSSTTSDESNTHTAPIDWISKASQDIYSSHHSSNIFHIVIKKRTLFINQTRINPITTAIPNMITLYEPNGYLHPCIIQVVKLMAFQPYLLPKMVEFFLNCDDGPLNNPAVFSWAKLSSSNDTIWPYWSFLYLDQKILRGIRGSSHFQNKQSIAIWRGFPSGFYWYAQLTINDKQLESIPFASKVASYLGTSLNASQHQLSMSEMCQKYKYIIIVDGSTAPSSRLLTLAFCNSLLLIQNSPWREYWYRGLRPYVHYLPISRTFTDLEDQLHWARSNPQEVERMIENMNRYAESYLTDEASTCFMYHQLINYATMYPSPRRYDTVIKGFEANYTISINYRTSAGNKRFGKLFPYLREKQ